MYLNVGYRSVTLIECKSETQLTEVLKVHFFLFMFSYPNRFSCSSKKNRSFVCVCVCVPDPWTVPPAIQRRETECISASAGFTVSQGSLAALCLWCEWLFVPYYLLK